MRRFIALLACATLALAGCNQPAATPAADESTAAPDTASATATPTPAAGPAGEKAASATHEHADWAGKWIGQEGLYADITPTTPGKYKLQMQLDLDGDGTYEGTDAPGGIAFVRGGETKLLRKGTAEEINLKWVDGDDCLMVEEFVGFCRD